MATESSFPRGGKRKNNEKLNTSVKEENEDLFKIIKDKKTSKKSRRKNNAEKYEETEDEETVVIECLSPKTILADMLVLGCLRDVGDYGLSIALPGGLTGKLPLTNISDQYTEELQRYSENPETLQDISTLSSMYEVGTCLPMRVMSHILDSSTSKSSTTLSIKPKDVNKSISPNSIHNGMLLLSSVQSIEDHGYAMDVGIGHFKGFLSKSKCAQATSLSVGQTVLCAVDMPNFDSTNVSTHRVLTLTTKKKMFNILDLDESHISLDSLLPCNQIKCMIMETRNNGLVVKSSHYVGCVYRDNLKNVFDSPSTYEVGKTVVATVLYRHPVTNTLHLSLAGLLTPSNFKKVFSSVKYGEIFEEAKVVNVTTSRVYFQVNDKVKAMAKLKYLGDIQENIENASEMFNIGDKHRCRILGFNHVDRLALVSLKRDTFQQFFIDKNDIQVGNVFSGIIDRHVNQAVKVKLGQGTFGLVPYFHLADQEIFNPSRQFPPGTKVQCRVLRIDKVGNYISPLLTCKRTLVLSKLPLLTSLEQAEVDAIYHGCVVKANSSGVTVAFYNDVKGWVPVEELSTEYIQYPEKMFFAGQVVRARVLNCKPEKKRLFLSLKVENKKPFGLKDLGVSNKLRPGHTVSVKVVNKSEDGLDVLVLPNELKGFLPVNHLSDFPRLCQLFLELYDIGDVITNALCFSTRGTIIISKKRVLCESAASGHFINSVKDIQSGQVIPGVVKAFLNYGIFLELGSGVSGLVRRKHIIDGIVEEPSRVGYITHQSVITKVLDVHHDTRRISLSTRLSDVCEWPIDDEESVRWLDDFLKDWKELGLLHAKKGSNKNLAEMKIASIVQVTVKSVTPEGLLCETDKGVAGLVTKQNIGAMEPEVNMSTQAIVLHLDWKNNCVELSVCPDLLRKQKHQKCAGSKKFSHLLGQSVSGTILMIRTHFALAVLHKAAEGILAYVPLFKHPNDLVGIPYKTGDVIQLSVKKACKRFLICSKVFTEVTTKNEHESNVKKTTKRKQDDDLFSSELNSLQVSKLKKKKVVVDHYIQKTGSCGHDKQEQEQNETRTLEINRESSLSVQSGVVSNLNKKFVFVKLDSGHICLLKKEEIKNVELDSLAIGTEVTVQSTGKGSSSQLQLLSVAKTTKKEKLPVVTPVVKHQFGKIGNQNSEESDSEDTQCVVAKIGLSKFNVPIMSSTEEKAPLCCLPVNDGLQWDIEAAPNLSAIGKKEILLSESSDDESGSEAKKTRSSTKSKRNKHKEEEDYLVKQEQRLMDSGREPETVDDFDRLILAQPDNSVVWLKYMSFHLQQAEVDKARAVAQKALGTISFREEQEKLNIWFALLNLETLYGTSESLDTTFQKATQFNEPFKVYMHMAKIYTQNEKNQEAEKLYNDMLKKFKVQPQVWLDYGLHCLKTGKNHKASDLFQQCLKSLDKRHHVEVVSKFAHMEFKYGESERGKTMLESLLASYPKRTDLWSQYADLLLKHGDIQGTRQILERSISNNLSAKRMKFLFKKYMDFEKQHGNEELVEKLKQKALDYVQSGLDM